MDEVYPRTIWLNWCDENGNPLPLFSRSVSDWRTSPHDAEYVRRDKTEEAVQYLSFKRRLPGIKRLREAVKLLDVLTWHAALNGADWTPEDWKLWDNHGADLVSSIIKEWVEI